MPSPTPAVNGRAAFSRCGSYRWLLERCWCDSITPQHQAHGHDTLIFCGLNPSRADASSNDPTLRRLSGFAQTWGYRRLVVLNLFALITPSPAALRRHPRPVGVANDAVLNSWLQRWCRRPDWTLWLGWGAGGGLYRRDQWMAARLSEVISLRQQHGGSGPLCLGTTRSGHPRHPLYLPGSASLQHWIATPSAPLAPPPTAAAMVGIGHPGDNVWACTVRR